MLQGKYQVPSPNTMECTWQGSSLSTGSYYLGCVLKKCGEGWGAGVQPQQSPGIPSGWAVLVKEWHGKTKLQWVRPITYFHKELLYLVFTLREMNDAKSYRVSPNITSVLSLLKPGFFSAYLSHKQCCVHYLLALEACEHFMTLFW